MSVPPTASQLPAPNTFAGIVCVAFTDARGQLQFIDLDSTDCIADTHLLTQQVTQQAGYRVVSYMAARFRQNKGRRLVIRQGAWDEVAAWKDRIRLRFRLGLQ